MWGKTYLTPVLYRYARHEESLGLNFEIWTEGYRYSDKITVCAKLLCRVAVLFRSTIGSGMPGMLASHLWFWECYSGCHSMLPSGAATQCFYSAVMCGVLWTVLTHRRAGHSSPVLQIRVSRILDTHLSTLLCRVSIHRMVHRGSCRHQAGGGPSLGIGGYCTYHITPLRQSWL